MMSATQQITIQGREFTVPAPYVEGHQCTAAEARILNSAFAENLRNNFSKRIKARTSAAPLTPTGEAELQAELQQYAATYSFAAGPGNRRSFDDPASIVARRIAADLVREALRARGAPADALPADILAERVSALAEREDVRAEAERRIAATRAIAFDDLDIAALTQPSPPQP